MMMFMMTVMMTITQLEDYPRPTSLSFEKLKEEGEGEEGAVLYVPSKGITLQVAFFTIKINFEFLQDVKQIFPTFVILVVTFVLMFTLIPYAFSEVIK